MSVEEAVQRAINFNASDIGPVANAFYNDRSEVAAIMGPIGSGKTSVSLMKPLAIACEQQPNGSGIRYYKHIVLRDTYRNLYNTVIPSWLGWIPKDFGQWRGGGSGEPAEHRIRFKVGSDGTIVDAWFMFVAVGDQNIEDVLRGLEVSTAHMNEMDRLNPNVLPFLRGRVGRYPSKNLGMPTFKGCWGDLNAPDEDNYCVKLFIYEKPDEFAFYEQPGGREPNAENLKNLPDGYYQSQVAGTQEDLVRRLIDNKIGYSREGKPVYTSYNDSLHAAERALQPVPGLPLYLGADAGLTPAVVIAQQLGTGQWIILDELIAEDAGAWRFGEQLNRLLKDRYRGFSIAAATHDPAGLAKSATEREERSWAQIMRLVTGINWRPAQTNSPIIRIDAVNGCLTRLIDGVPGFKLSPACKTLRRGFLSGYFLKDGSPCKNEFSHPHDALQYLLLGGGEYLEVMSRTKKRQHAAGISTLNTNFRVLS